MADAIGRIPPIRDTRIRGIPVNLNGKTQLGHLMHMGPGIYDLSLVFNVVVTIGTATGVIEEGLLKFVKQLYMKTDAGDVPLDNVSGRAMYKAAITKAKCTPLLDTLAAASATYQFEIPIYFADPLLVRPEDTILDTNRYQSIQFEMLCGGIADLFSSVGTGVIAVTVDVPITRSKSRWDSANAGIAGVVEYSQRNPVDASVTTEIKLENAPDLTLKRLYLHACTSGAAGQQWSGSNSNAIVDVVSLTDANGDWVKDSVWEETQAENKRLYSLETNIAGVNVFDFVRDRSIKSGIYTGATGEMVLEWSNQSAPAALSLVSVLTESYRTARLGA
jgi:hypothetical protein